MSEKWFELRRIRITASYFGEILWRRDSTKPDSLVLKIMGTKQSQKDSQSMAWGRKHGIESVQIDKTGIKLQKHGDHKFWTVGISRVSLFGCITRCICL